MLERKGLALQHGVELLVAQISIELVPLCFPLKQPGETFRSRMSGSPKTRFCKLFSQDFLMLSGARVGFELVAEHAAIVRLHA
jgi:hypothetical protein